MLVGESLLHVQSPDYVIGLQIAAPLKSGETSEAQRIIRISEEVRISLERPVESCAEVVAKEDRAASLTIEKLTSSKLGRRLGMRTNELLERAVAAGYLELQHGEYVLSTQGASAGIEFVAKSRHGAYYLWPENISL
ncbi:hypothetical protein [Pandoraea sp. SD6-2]|uniref:hypothetical protein n=1 Tax=Pandoraea sp. SD6-2 TaxID=1286093 RepID=UPI0011859901|nr:hypothetical protein [Pandoraea sp. SD6-2]